MGIINWFRNLFHNKPEIVLDNNIGNTNFIEENYPSIFNVINSYYVYEYDEQDKE